MHYSIKRKTDYGFYIMHTKCLKLYNSFSSQLTQFHLIDLTNCARVRNDTGLHLVPRIVMAKLSGVVLM